MQAHSFGHWLKLRRKALDLTQAQLASQVGCSAAAIRKIEAEERRPSAQIAGRLAEIFNIPQNEQSSFLKYARGELRHAPAESIGETPWHAGTSLRTNLPAPITSFLGRENEQKEVLDLLAKHRLVTLIGPPGIGKTRLSIESARQSLADFPDGVFFVALAPLEDPNLIAPTIVQALGFVATKNEPPVEHLKAGIGKKQMLIVLDNCEHLIEETVALASDLLSACSRLKTLTTSRESLRVTGEQLYPVPALEVPKEGSTLDADAVSAFPALTLFAERARSVSPDFALNAENLPAVSTICAKLDGLPLAIELIAARMRLFSPQSLLERLTDQFILSADGVRAVSARQKTLQNAIGWSYSLLSEEEQKLFARLSVFSGGFTMESAEAMFSRTVTEKAVTDLIASLLDKSLLQRTFEGETHAPRFSMLVTIQQFALTRLRHMGEEAEARGQHLAYFLALAEQADKQIHGPDQLKWIDRVQDELDNFRAALHRCVSDQKTETALRLLTSLGWAWQLRNHYREALDWFNVIRRLPGVMDHPLLYARLLNHISQHSWVLGDFDHARSLLEESYAILVMLGVEGEPDLAMNLWWFGMVAHAGEADNKAARSFCERSLELYHKHEDLWGMAFVSVSLGITISEWDGDISALPLFKQSLEWFRQLGDIWGIARVSQWLGNLFLKQGNYEKARLHFEEHLKIDEGLRFKQGMMAALQNLGDLYRYQGDDDQATRFYEKSLSLCREYNHTWGISNNLLYLGLAALHRNNYQQARRYFIDYYDLARAIYGGGVGECDFLTGMVAVAGGTNQPERAARLYGAAQALFETTDYRIPPFDQAEFNRHIRIAQEQLGGGKFEELMAEGHAMTMEQAIEYALEWSTAQRS